VTRASFDIHHADHAERRAMMLVEGDAVEADLLSVDLLIDVLVE
jgi:hypothetical protein